MKNYILLISIIASIIIILSTYYLLWYILDNDSFLAKVFLPIHIIPYLIDYSAGNKYLIIAYYLVIFTLLTFILQKVIIFFEH